jgi:hypothetical protein
MSRLDKLEETNIKKLVIVDCHGVTKSSRKTPHANSVTVRYPTILTAHLGTQTRVCGNLDTPAVEICEILTDHIDKDPDTFSEGVSLGEISRVLQMKAVETGTGGLTVFAEGTPIKPKLPGESFQNVELFCPGVRPGQRAPVGNTDGVWVCDLFKHSCTDVTKSMFKDGLTYGENLVVKESEYDETLGMHVITTHSWLNTNNSIVTYQHLIAKLNRHPDLYPIETTAILLATCRKFEDDDDDDDVDGDAVPSNPGEQQPQQQQQQQPPPPPPPPQQDDDFWITDMVFDGDATLGDGKRRTNGKSGKRMTNGKSGKRMTKGKSGKRRTKGKSGKRRTKGTSGGSNKKRRYTKRKKYFNSMRRVKVNKLKKRRTRKYKNKK